MHNLKLLNTPLCEHSSGSRLLSRVRGQDGWPRTGGDARHWRDHRPVREGLGGHTRHESRLRASYKCTVKTVGELAQLAHEDTESVKKPLLRAFAEWRGDLASLMAGGSAVDSFRAQLAINTALVLRSFTATTTSSRFRHRAFLGALHERQRQTHRQAGARR
jgi:hypothetical protein